MPRGSVIQTRSSGYLSGTALNRSTGHLRRIKLPLRELLFAVNILISSLPDGEPQKGRRHKDHWLSRSEVLCIEHHLYGLHPTASQCPSQ